MTSKAPKKARQEDDDYETSDADVEAIKARKKEIESVIADSPKKESEKSNVENMSPPKQVVNQESDTDTDVVSKVVVKPGPKRKKAGTGIF